ncbi:hypothetical protein HPP92_020590 [Vanilla planifolia]|uniref:Uncharacterized protein n=1 Tax=Vanilla planifolia TaxID=51239 RepID=A0A835Q5H2_VANPL|nr:hypothetical protein HPP92_020590 [Vanilla planifolia]
MTEVEGRAFVTVISLRLAGSIEDKSFHTHHPISFCGVSAMWRFQIPLPVSLIWLTQSDKNHSFWNGTIVARTMIRFAYIDPCRLARACFHKAE